MTQLLSSFLTNYENRGRRYAISSTSYTVYKWLTAIEKEDWENVPYCVREINKLDNFDFNQVDNIFAANIDYLQAESYNKNKKKVLDIEKVWNGTKDYKDEIWKFVQKELYDKYVVDVVVYDEIEKFRDPQAGDVLFNYPW